MGRGDSFGTLYSWGMVVSDCLRYSVLESSWSTSSRHRAGVTSEYVERVLRGERRPLSRVLTWVQAGDPQTTELARTILAQEREAARSLSAVFDAAAAASLRAVGVAG